MKKIVEDAIASANNEKNNKVETAKKNVKTVKKSNRNDAQESYMIAGGVDNKELEEVLAGLTTTIKVVGCGGAGTNTIARCFAEGITGAALISINTDAQHLLLSESPHKILIGRHLTRGLGAGSLPQIGDEAARESEQDIRGAIVPADMIFVTCG
ncbi:MAG: cell division protein FtsZ, partial [Thermoplasmatales archaeon]|nr:cell division protein FtsZ [Thermoplasmatales archaeon]